MLASETLKLKNGRAWQVYGGGAGPTLLWLRGLGGINAGDPMLVALERKHRIVAPVAPGFNDLDELNDIGNIHELALDYDDLLEHLGIEGAAFVGHSSGAMIAAEVAAHFPRRAKQLVLLAPVGLWNDSYPLRDIFAEPFMQVEALLWHDKEAHDALAARRSNEAGPQNDAERIIAVAQGLTAVAKFVWPIPDRGLRKRLPRVAAASLAIFGAEDHFISPRYAEDFSRGLRRVQTAVIKGAGHMLPYEKTEEVAALIERFLAGPA